MSDLREAIKLDFIKCSQDPAYFMRKYCYIQHPQKGRILFDLYEFQASVLHLLRDNPYQIVLKSRQLGISTLAAGYSLWLMTFHENKNCLCIATKQETAKNMVTKVKFMYDNLPSWLKVDFEEKNKLTLRLKNGSQIKATSAAGDAGRSEAVSYLIIDEAAFIDNIGEIWASAQQTLACIEKNSIIYTDKGLFRIEDLYDNPDIGFNKHDLNIFNRDNKIENSTYFYKSPVSKTYKINFEDGNSIITTKEHPLLDKNEKWIKTENLVVGDYIKCFYNQQTFGKPIDYNTFLYNQSNNSKPFMISNKDMAYLMGLFIAEGSYRKNGISIASGDKEIQEWLLNLGATYSGRVNYSINRKYINVLFKDFLKIKGGAFNKTVPNKILSSSKEEQISFLQGCFDGDGSSHSKGISYYSVSEQLVKDIHIMLLNFGIRSKISKVFWKSNKLIKKETTGYRLDINKINSIKYYEYIGFRLKRKQNNINKISNIKNWGGVNLNIDKNIIRNIILGSGYSLSEWNRNFTNIEGFLWRKNKNISYQSIQDILENCDSKLYEYKVLYDLFKSLDNLYYNKIVSIEEHECITTYDLKVPGSTSFIANNIVNHNTGGGATVLSTPYGTGNWFHQMWVKAESNENQFIPIKLPWFVHPERNQEWRDAQNTLLGDPRLAAQECFSGDVIIYTKHGPKEIKDINLGDEVLSHDGTYNKVIRTMSHYSNKAIKIKSGLNNIEKFVTNNHPFLDQYGSWVDVENIILNNNKIKYFPTNIKINKKENIIDLIDILKSNSPKHFPIKHDDEFIWITKTNKIKRFISYDYDLGKLIGLFMAEGSLALNKVEFSFNGKTERKGFPLEIERILSNKFNINNFSYYTSKRWEGSSKLFIKDQLFQNFIKHNIQGGEKCFNKHLSNFFYNNSNKDVLKGFIDGIMLGDGMLKKEYNISLLLTSKKLIYDVLYISNILGIHNITLKQGISKSPKTGKEKPNYTLTWTNSIINSNEKLFSKRIEKWEGINTYGKSKVSPNFEFIYGESLVSLKSDLEYNNSIVYNLEIENTHTYVTEYGIAHNCDCDFNTSGDTVIHNEDISYIEQNFIKDPVYKRGIGKDLWIWQDPDYSKEYMALVDVARGDGKDSSTVQVIEIESNEQVAEYKGQLPPKELGNFCVALATEYNYATLVIENNSFGWSTIQQAIELDYKKLYYSPKNNSDITNSYFDPYYDNTNMIAGFVMSLKTRPIIIGKFQEYVNEKSLIIRSKRTLAEVKTFIWKNGRAEAQSGYNDDLIMPLGIGMYLRDTILVNKNKGLDMTKSMLNSVNVNRTSYQGGYSGYSDNPYNVSTPYGNQDISWLIS